MFYCSGGSTDCSCFKIKDSRYFKLIFWYMTVQYFHCLLLTDVWNWQGKNYRQYEIKDPYFIASTHYFILFFLLYIEIHIYLNNSLNFTVTTKFTMRIHSLTSLYTSIIFLKYLTLSICIEIILVCGEFLFDWTAECKQYIYWWLLTVWFDNFIIFRHHLCHFKFVTWMNMENLFLIQQFTVVYSLS